MNLEKSTLDSKKGPLRRATVRAEVARVRSSRMTSGNAVKAVTGTCLRLDFGFNPEGSSAGQTDQQACFYIDEKKLHPSELNHTDLVFCHHFQIWLRLARACKQMFLPTLDQVSVGPGRRLTRVNNQSPCSRVWHTIQGFFRVHVYCHNIA